MIKAVKKSNKKEVFVASGDKPVNFIRDFISLTFIY